MHVVFAGRSVNPLEAGVWQVSPTKAMGQSQLKTSSSPEQKPSFSHGLGKQAPGTPSQLLPV
jgi:hypothetical protein